MQHLDQNSRQRLSTHLVGLALATFGALTVSGCATTGPASAVSDQAPAEKSEAVNYTIDSAAWQPAPACMWVKPFTATEAHREPARLAHDSVWAQIAARGYTLAPVDAAKADETCDYVLEGELTDAQRKFMLFFSSNTVGANVRLVRRSTQQVLWSASDAIALKDGGLPLSFLGLSSGVFAATENMKPDRYLMAIDALARRLVASLPYHDKPSPTPTAVDWPVDLDAWLESKPVLDREQALLQLMSQPLSATQSEAGFARLVVLSPSPENWRNWVTARMQRAESARALALFEKAGDRLLMDPQSNYLKARVLSSMRRYDEAVKPLMMAIKQNPYDPNYYEALAHLEVQRQDNARAIAAFTKVVALDPAQAYAWLNIGVLAHAVGDSETALDALKEAGRLYLQRRDTNALDTLLEVLQEMSAQGDLQARDLASQIATSRQRVEGEKS